MADNTKLILFGAAGVAIWWFYFRAPAAPASTVISGGAASPGTPATSTAPPVTTSTIDALYKSILSASGNPSAGLGVDQWGYYLNNALASSGKAAPDPLPLFTAAIPNFDRSQLVTIDKYWAVMAPALRSQLGLSGLGAYGNLALMSQGWR
jgi:hypothetical protein